MAKMAECGTEAFALFYSATDGNVRQLGSAKGLAFADKRPDIHSQFLAFVSGLWQVVNIMAVFKPSGILASCTT